MQDIEQSNWRQIEVLNQRGGRTLSIADLIAAGTISPEMAGYLGAAIGRGASFLTAARPGGAGKTALLAALLGLLAPGVPIVTVDRPEVVPQARRSGAPACYLAHEIGAGHWYGYLWGPPVAGYLALADGKTSIASCLHADTPEEVYQTITSPPIGAPREALLGVELLVFVQVEANRTAGRHHIRRRVSAVYQADRQAGTHRLVFQWNRARDAFEPVSPLNSADGDRALAELLAGAARNGPTEFAALREAYVAFTTQGSMTGRKR